MGRRRPLGLIRQAIAVMGATISAWKAGGPVPVVRSGDWKLHLYQEEWQLDGGRAGLATNNAVELYNLRADIGERQNLAPSEIRRRDELLDGLLGWLKTTGALLPFTPNLA